MKKKHRFVDTHKAQGNSFISRKGSKPLIDQNSTKRNYKFPIQQVIKEIKFFKQTNERRHLNFFDTNA